jgi:FkbM family methyltransferase
VIDAKTSIFMKFLPVDVIQIENQLEKKALALLQGDALTYVFHRDGVYEKHFLDLARQIVKKGDYVVDMGANLGYHTITLAQLVENEGRVFAFEPQRITFQQLNCNVFLNKLDNVYAYNAAVGEDNSHVFIENVDYHKVVDGYYGTNIGNTSVNSNSVGDEIPKITLDSLNLPKASFIKIDVQGCELLALIGARKTIIKCRPILFVEIEAHHLVKFNATPESLKEYIKSLGYNMFQINNEYPVDHLCIPVESDLHIKLDWQLVKV